MSDFLQQRDELHAKFVRAFASSREPKKVVPEELAKMELALKTILPASYKIFLLRYGPISTGGILAMLTDRGIDFPDLQDFLEPAEAIKNTQGYWSAGMPETMVGVASDCMGNMIGFPRDGDFDDRVLFFDHDYCKVDEIASDFDTLLTWYLTNLNDQERA